MMISMTRVPRGLRAFATLLLLVAAVVALGSTSAGAASGWTVGQPVIPLAPEGTLLGVACPAAGSCVAVGYAFDAVGEQVPLAETLSGTTWTPLTTPVPGGSVFAQLSGVSCASVKACVAVGTYRAEDRSTPPFSEVWNGTTWSIEAIPEPPNADATLSAVSCSSPSACTAVGNIITTGAAITLTLAERWNGKVWSSQTTPDPNSKVNVELSGVSCPSAIACIAVGSGANRPLAESWNGTTWTLETTVAPKGSYETLAAVSCQSAHSCTAVGSYRSRPHFYTLLEYWNGSTWAIEGPVPTVENAVPDSLSCTSHTSCMAVGTITSDQVTLAELWNGSTWTVERTVKTVSNQRHLYGVACTSADACLAVGNYVNYGNPNLVTLGEAWNGTTWTLDKPRNPGAPILSKLTAIACPSADYCMAVGWYEGPNDFLAEDWNGKSWGIVPTPPFGNGALGADTPDAISCLSAEFCMTVGSGDAGENLTFAAVWNGTSWALDPAPAPNSQYGGEFGAVSCTSATFCMALGHGVQIWNGTSWGTAENVPLPVWKTDTSTGTTNGVSCTSATSCTVVGWYTNLHTPGSMLADSWNGTRWSVETSPIVTQTYQQETLASVSCSSGLDCIAVGTHDVHGVVTALGASDDGTALTVDASAATSGTPGALTSVSCLSSTRCEAVGQTATAPVEPVVENWNGSVWSPESVATPTDANTLTISGIGCTASTSCIAVGYTTYGIADIDVPLIEMGS
jgi:hypothetical protein